MAADNKTSTKNCTFVGGTDNSRFGDPMLWIGLYVAVASFACTAAIGADIIRSVRWGKQWFPPKFFVLNAALLTILGIATKIPSDVNGAMPGLLDQFAKLSGILLICVAMSHAMPSLGVMNNWELLSNMVALGILVTSTAVNIWFQIHTKLITEYSFRNNLYTIIMLLMFLILVSHSLSVATVKLHLEKQYHSKHRKILEEVKQQVLSGEMLEEYVKKYWLMALTSSPGFVMLTSGMSVACTSLYLFVATGFIPSLLMTFRKRCYVHSDYRCFAVPILCLQFPAIIGGVVSSILRSRSSIVNLRQILSFKKLIYVEKYRMQQLEMWKKDALPFHARHETVRNAAYHVKTLGVNILILFQRSMIFLTRLIVLLAFYECLILFSIPWALYFALTEREYPWTFHTLMFRNLTEKETPASPPLPSSLEYYVLSLEEESEDQRDRINKHALKWKDYPDRWFHNGRDRSPDGLHKLIKKFSIDKGSSRVLRTTSIRRSRTVITSEILGDCWSLHLGTLMCIIYAVFYGTPQGSDNLESLMKALDEGFLYFMLVDANKDEPGNKKARDAAKMVWENLLFRREWLDVRLERLPAGESFANTLGDLQGLAKEHADRYEKEDLPGELSSNAVAAQSMSRIAGALLDCEEPFSSFEELEKEAAGIVEACLVNLPVSILRECSNGSYGYREEHVRLAAQVLGETEKIRKSLEARRSGS